MASSTITTTPDEDSDSVYTTANQTPIVDIFTALLGKLAFFMSNFAKHKIVASLDRYCEGFPLSPCFNERTVLMLDILYNTG